MIGQREVPHIPRTGIALALRVTDVRTCKCGSTLNLESPHVINFTLSPAAIEVAFFKKFEILNSLYL